MASNATRMPAKATKGHQGLLCPSRTQLPRPNTSPASAAASPAPPPHALSSIASVAWPPRKWRPLLGCSPAPRSSSSMRLSAYVPMGSTYTQPSATQRQSREGTQGLSRALMDPKGTRRHSRHREHSRALMAIKGTRRHSRPLEATPGHPRAAHRASITQDAHAARGRRRGERARGTLRLDRPPRRRVELP